LAIPSACARLRPAAAIAAAGGAGRVTLASCQHP
jgi:hypothetical protein